MTAIFKVIKPGLQTTVQDLGRYGYQQFGISPAGAMDEFAMQVANILVGNPTAAAVLEFAFIGPVLEALTDITIAVCGGNFAPKMKGREVQQWKSLRLKKGDVLSVGAAKAGAYGYIAVSGGIDVPEVMGSKSTLLNGGFGGLDGRVLKSGDLLAGRPEIRRLLKRLHPSLIPEYRKRIEIRVIPGPHVEMFTTESVSEFFSEEYRVSTKANRMGFQLEGPRLKHAKGPDIISDSVPLGGIQVPASGQPIILMADRQTTGGYARIGTVISVDIPTFAQAVPGTVVKFSQISLEEAQELYVKRRTLLKLMSLK
jgi:antagonist of KipI